jgi:hypothetical protein
MDPRSPRDNSRSGRTGAFLGRPLQCEFETESTLWRQLRTNFVQTGMRRSSFHRAARKTKRRAEARRLVPNTGALRFGQTPGQPSPPQVRQPAVEFFREALFVIRQG